MSPSELSEPLVKSTKLISVVTVCRNAQETIEATLQSVAGQIQVSGFVEHIVVDGSSEDDTLSVVKKFPAVRWISEPDDGISDAFNKGAHLAEGEYLLYLNADDYLYDHKVLHDVIEFININQHPDWIVGDVLVSNGGEITVPPGRYRPTCRSLMLRNRICHQSVFLKRHAQLQVGGFDARFKMAMDYDLWQRLCARGYNLVYLQRIISVYSKEGLTSNYKSPTLLQEQDEVIRRCRDNPWKRLVGIGYDYLKGRI